MTSARLLIFRPGVIINANLDTDLEGRRFPMRRRLVLVTLLLVLLMARLSAYVSSAQTPDELPPSVIRSPSPTLEIESVAEEADDQQLAELSPGPADDAVMALTALRRAVAASPDSGADRLKLAQGLYLIGDLDAALDECRAALKLDPVNAKAHLQLGIMLTAKQEGRAAATALVEAIHLDPELTHAHYSLGAVQYSFGDLAAAIRSYQRALEFQPDFPDARYRLALVLRLANRNQEATRFMEEAASGGISQAQYFMGYAYRNGQGVEKSLPLAIRWWTKAVAFGHQRAMEPLSQLRRQALSPDQPERRRREAIEAFRQYRESLWTDHPDAVRNDPHESLGIALLKDSRTSKGVSALLEEAFALSEPAHDELARLYESGLETHLAQFDKRILACFETTASDGFTPAKKALARIYGKGLGVTPDLRKAKTVLKGLPKQETKLLLDAIATP